MLPVYGPNYAEFLHTTKKKMGRPDLDYTTISSNGKVSDERGKVLRETILSYSSYYTALFLVGLKENNEKPQSGQLVTEPRLKPITSRIKV
jgi:hypothetical protein